MLHKVEKKSPAEREGRFGEASRAHLTKKQPFGCHHDAMQENRRRSSPPLPPKWVDPARVDDRLPPWLLCVCPILRDSPLGPWLVSETGPSAP